MAAAAMVGNQGTEADSATAARAAAGLAAAGWVAAVGAAVTEAEMAARAVAWEAGAMPEVG